MLRIHLTACALVVHFCGLAQMTDYGRWPSLDVLADGVEISAAVLGEEELNAFAAYTQVNRLIIEENWVEAEALLAKMMAEAPDNRNFAFKRALCLRAIKGRLEEAVPLAMLSVQGDFEKRYNPFDVAANLPPETALDMALEVLQFSGHYAEAQAVALSMMERYSERDYLYAKAKRAHADCAFAMVCIGDPQRMNIREEMALNSGSADFAPVLTPDGEAVYFTSYRDQDGDEAKKRGRIFRSSRNHYGWSRPVALDMGASGCDMTTVGVMGDDESLLVYQSHRNEGAVWKVEKDAFGAWDLTEKLGYPIDSRHWETSIAERFDGQERVFVSDRPGGLGGRDLYRTVRLPDGTWSEPLNLGSRINTSGEEESPVLSADGRFLVFSSNGHQGMGGFDLFRCVRLDNGSWSEPRHLGHPLNTPGDEAMVTLDASGQSGYLSSKRMGGLDLDIYRVDVLGEPEEALAVMLGKVHAWKEGDVVEVKSIDEGPAVFRVFRARPGSGDFVAALPPCREYKMSWVRRGEAIESRTEFIGCDAAYGNAREVSRLAPFGREENGQILTREVPDRKQNQKKVETESEEQTVVDMVSKAPLKEASAVQVQSHSVDLVVAEESTSGNEPDARSVEDDTEKEAEVLAPTAVGFVEFEAVTTTVEFGYGRYLTQAGSSEVEVMVAEVLARNAMGEVPTLEIEGGASFVPVKNKRAYESNEQLAKMRAEKARDAIVKALSDKGLEVGVDFQVVLDWKVAGPEFQGDAISEKDTYRNFQYAKFSLGRQRLEKRR